MNRSDEPAAAAAATRRQFCPVCGPRETVPELDIEGFVPLVRCPSCDLVFSRDLPDDAALAAAYADSRGISGKRFGGPFEGLVDLFRGSRVRLALRLAGADARVLDVGCGSGAFLRLLARRGPRVRGIERPGDAEVAAGTDLEVDAGELAPGSYRPASFDLVCIWHVLEHARRPEVMLAGAREAITPDGVLLLAMPNYDSLQARWGGPHWFPLDPERHLFHFTPTTLARLLEAEGFRIERLRTGQWEMDPFGIVQTALNRMGLPRDAFFRGLSANAKVRSGVSFRLRFVSALFAQALALPALVWFAVESLRGRGGSMIVVARPATKP